MEELRKEKNEVEERTKKYLREKDEAESMAQKRQATIQKLYKEIPEVRIVVEDTMEEKVLKIGEVIKGFQSNIEDL